MDITNGNGHDSPIFKCDFCSSPHIVWDYSCVSYEVITVLEDTQGRVHVFPWASDNGWAACNVCSELIEQERWSALAKRSIDNLPGMSDLDTKLVEGVLIKAVKEYQRMFAVHHGPRKSIKFG